MQRAGDTASDLPLDARIAHVYLALEERTDPRGSKLWFAKQAGVHANTVSRWITGRRPRRYAYAVLRQLEARAALISSFRQG
jgi:hypothetical protein